MSEEIPITIQPYSDKSVLVQGDYDTHAKQMKKFQARWNPRLKAGPGWLVPVDFESAVRSYFGVEEPAEDAHASQRFKPAPAKKAPAKKKPVEEPVEEEPVEEEDTVAELPPKAAPVSASKAAPSASKAAPVSASKAAPSASKAAPAVSIPKPRAAAPVDNDDDIVSLARKMKDMMARIERLESR